MIRVQGSCKRKMKTVLPNKKGCCDYMKVIVLTILGFLCFALGAKGLNQAKDFDPNEVVIIEDGITSEENEGKTLLVIGYITNNGLAKDEYFGVTVRTPVLKRTGVMCQYLRPSANKADHGYPDIGYSENSEGDFTQANVSYWNPSFDSEYKSKVFYSDDITVNNGNLQIDGKFVENMFHSDYIYFENLEPKTLRVKQLNNPKVEGFVNMDNHYFYDSGHAKDIGDIDISYDGLAPSFLEETEVSILGVQENGKLVSSGIADKIYNRRMSIEEIDASIQSTAKSGGATAFILGTIFLIYPGIMLFIIIKEAADKKDSNYRANI